MKYLSLQSNFGQLEKTLPRDAFVMGMPLALMDPTLAKRFGVNPSAVDKSWAAMMRAGINPGSPWQPRAPVQDPPQFFEGNISGVAHSYGQRVRPSNRDGAAIVHALGCFAHCFDDGVPIPLTFGHGGEVLVEALRLYDDRTPEDERFPALEEHLRFYSDKLIRNSAASEEVVLYAMEHSSTHGIEFSVEGSVVESHWENRLGEDVEVVDVADLQSIALLLPHENEHGNRVPGNRLAACQGTSCQMEFAISESSRKFVFK